MKYLLVGIKENQSALLKSILIDEKFHFIEPIIDYKKALNLILKFKPALIIVDIDIIPHPFDFINDVNNFLDLKVHIIVISNSSENAYKALKNHVSDYLLAPIDELEFRKSILFLKKKLEHNSNDETNLCLKSYKDFHYINLKDILFLKADNNTTDFYTKNGKIITSYNTLKKFENILPPKFKRIHKSYVVNSTYVTRVNFGKSICNINNLEVRLPFSKTYLNNMREINEDLHQKSTVELN